jgi:hypothetical protein
MIFLKDRRPKFGEQFLILTNLPCPSAKDYVLVTMRCEENHGEFKKNLYEVNISSAPSTLKIQSISSVVVLARFKLLPNQSARPFEKPLSTK